MKKIISILLLLIVMIFSIAACNTSDNTNAKSTLNNANAKFALPEHKVELNAPELENISNFEFDDLSESIHCFADKDGNLYEISFDKPFYETKTNVKPKKSTNAYDDIFRMQLNEAWINYTDFVRNEGLDTRKTVCLERKILTFNENKLYYISNTKHNGFKLLKEFDENIISLNGCIIKTESKYYSIENYLTNKKDVEKYADAKPKYSLRIIELSQDMFAIPIENIVFFYKLFSDDTSYFLIDKNYNYYFNKTYIGTR